MLLVREILGPRVWKENGNVVLGKGGSPELIGNRDRLGFALGDSEYRLSHFAILSILQFELITDISRARDGLGLTGDHTFSCSVFTGPRSVTLP